MRIPPDPLADYLLSIGGKLLEEKYAGYKKIELYGIEFIVPIYTRGLCCVFAKFENPPEKIKNSPLYNKETKEYNFFTKWKGYFGRLDRFKIFLEYVRQE